MSDIPLGLDDKTKYLTASEAARYLKMSPATLKRHRANSAGPKAIRLGRRIYFSVADLDSYINSLDRV